MIRRLLVLTNNTEGILYLREAQHGAEEGHYGHETRLDPYSVRRDFPATIYQGHNRDSGRPSKIVIFVGKDEALDSLTPEIFVRFVELIFVMDEVNNELIVYGIRARLTDFFRLWAFGFPGRDYSDRPRHIVRRCGFKVVKTATENEGSLVSGPEMTMIRILITYDGEWKNEKDGYIWSCGVKAKWEAILVDGNNLTLEVVVNEVREALGLNGLESKLILSYLPAVESYNPCPIYIRNSRSLTTYLSFGNYRTRPALHVETLKTNDDELRGEKNINNKDVRGGGDIFFGFD